MVLGLIDFLLGGKKKTQVPKNAQVASPVSNVASVQSQSTVTQVPNGQSIPTQNANTTNEQSGELQFQDSSGNEASTQSNVVQTSSFGLGGKKSVSQILGKMTADIKEISDTVVNISTEMKDIQNNLNSMDHRLSELENANNIKEEKLNEIDENMSKFLSLYEIVNNQYNPFINVEDAPIQKEIVINSLGASEALENEEKSLKEKLEELRSSKSEKTLKEEVNSSLLELDTIDLDSAAADAVPLNHLKSNTNSLVVILSWLEYLVKRAGIHETKKTLTYYTETLKWITPEVYFELDKFLRGMDDVEREKQEKLNVRDHIVSLYFISKLNEKRLDDKLTKAVLQIIKEK